MPPEDLDCDYIVSFTLKVTHPHFQFSYYILVNEANEALEFKNRRYSIQGERSIL